MREETIGDCRLILGDCREVLQGIEYVDALVTDPPYGIGQDKGMGTGGLRLGVVRNYDGGWDDERPSTELLLRAIKSARYSIIWGGNYLHDVLPEGRKWLFWDKLQSMPSYSDGEIAWTSLPGTSTKRFVFRQAGFRCSEKERWHPTQKPIQVMKWCIELLPFPNRLILDPFMGSGTTGVACVKLGRQFVGVERDPKFFDVACRRVEAAYNQPDLFVPRPESKPQQLTMDAL